ncbi:mediator of RNA polymerase II transcription subunit 6 [Rhodotorula diobovata]|uniref:Mediator of RNA polymerase II transcription subunit 6 n=1 Tax=Rhodotorula diobovata TaxID=5288 RepID=A0A5C5FQ65_9BASI|nr:mediator of RNA polymerase II transcription subunit 6 [Rhodotorula diobovata]
MAAAAPPVNLGHLQWRSPEYLLTTGGSLQTADQALDYFSYSPFFDKRSNNATLRMQMMFANGGMQGVDEEKELRRLTGLEFAISPLSRPQDDLFIVLKRQRTSPDNATVLGAFYILNGNVYQAPSLFEVLNERVLTSIHALSTSFSALAALKPAWTPERGGAWEIKPPPAAAASLADATAGATEAGADAGIDAGAEGAQQQAQGPERDEDTERAALPLSKDASTSAAADAERPPDAFNPLLFRALQAAAAKTAFEEAQGQ